MQTAARKQEKKVEHSFSMGMETDDWNIELIPLWSGFGFYDAVCQYFPLDHSLLQVNGAPNW